MRGRWKGWGVASRLLNWIEPGHLPPISSFPLLGSKWYLSTSKKLKPATAVVALAAVAVVAAVVAVAVVCVQAYPLLGHS